MKNILLNGSKINVIDWEWCTYGLPLIWDIWFFIFTMLRQLTAYFPFKRQPLEFCSLYKDKKHRLVQLLEKKVDKYIDEFAIDRRTILVLQKYLLFFLSERDYNRYGFTSDEDRYWSNILNILGSDS